jgi:iron complex outermembrane receptor protein
MRRGWLGALASLVLPVFVVAQDAPTDAKPETVKLEKFEVTGSRLNSASSQSDIPVFTIGKAQIEATPVVEVADYFKTFPAFTGAGNTNEQMTNGGIGGRFIDIRGLGNPYTLVLLNGRRLAYSGTDNFVDVNQIPVTAIDHVEVLTSGASAIYGTDAVGGVVNIITRTNQNGGEINLYYGDINFPHNGNRAYRSDLGRRQFAFSLGGSEGKVDFLVGAQYFKQNGIYSPDFNWSYAPGPTGNTFPYRLSLPNALFTPGATGNSNYVVKWKPGEGGRRDATSPGDFRPYQGRLPDVANPDDGGDQFPFFLYTPLLRPEERYHFFAFTSYQLNDHVKLFADIMARYAYSYNQLAPAAVPVPALGAIVIPATNYYNRQIFGANARDITAGGWRLLGLGPRLDTAEMNGLWFNAGAEGTVGDYAWKVQGLFTQESTQFLNGNTTSVDLINQYLNKTTADAFNPFSSKLDANAAIWPIIKRNAYQNQLSRLVNLEAEVSGPLFNVPAGQVNGAVSLEWNQVKAYFHPDALTQSTPLGFNGTPNPTDGARTQWGATAELDVPVFAQVTTRIAGRHDDYSDFGGVNVGQISLRYQPTKEWLFRASYGQGFLAPSLLQLYEGPQVTNPTFIDPTANNGDGTWGTNTQVSMTRVGNPNLGPEKSKMWNVGVVFSPRTIKGLTVSIDYFNTEIKNRVSTAENYAAIVAKRFWEALGPTDAARDAAARNPVTLAQTVAAIKQQTGVTVVWEPDGGPEGLGGLSQNNIALQDVFRTNLAGTKTDGADLNVTYTRQLGGWGNLTFDGKATYMRRFKFQALAGEPLEDLAGMYSSSFEGAWPKWRLATALDWRWKDVGANAIYHFSQSTKIEDGVDPVFNRDYLPSFATWDFQVSYRMPWIKTQLMVGVENACNQIPPLTSFATNNFVPSGVGDVRGRFWYVRLSQKF